MATVNFSVPQDVKTRFYEAFQGQNKSAIIARLMVEAVDAARARRRQAAAIRRILARRKQKPALSPAHVRTLRIAGRP